MPTSPILNKSLAKLIYNNQELESIFLRLEDSKKIVDEADALAKLVNTERSRAEPISRWIRYREGYSPTIVHRILEMFPIRSENEFILDPMCGSGSTQVAAQQLTIPSVGSDVSPYAVLVSRVKTTPLSKSQLRRIAAFLDDFSSVDDQLQIQKSASEDYLCQYFPEQNFNNLLRIKRKIGEYFRKTEGECDFLMVSLLAIIEACSNRRKDGNGLASRPSSITDVFDLFRGQVRQMLTDVQDATWLQTPSNSIVRSALQIDKTIPEFSQKFQRSLGAVVFSPPYANSFDYYESYKLELLMGDFFTTDSIRTERTNLIRSYRQMGKSERIAELPTLEALIREIMNRLPAKEKVSGVRDGRSRLLPNLLRGYFQDMQRFVQKAASAMPSGSYMAIVVDQSAYLGVLVPTDLLLAEIGMNCGFTLDKLVICRRARTSGQQLNLQPALGGVLRESAVVLRKL